MSELAKLYDAHLGAGAPTTSRRRRCGALLHSRTARYASGPSGASRMPSGAYLPPTCCATKPKSANASQTVFSNAVEPRR
ncbi:MAG TPA: hypothetical protein VGU66_09075 [Candidatus Elarobacter sp.]|nr:hypothetical protein [Candidatus Elarobacter sp.]